jgi:UDP-glucuronate decarboxylase
MNAETIESPTLAPVTSPVNLGSNVEFTIRDLVDVIQSVMEEINREKQVSIEKLKIEYVSLPVDDPRQRRPDITRAQELLQWSPTWKLKDGVREMALSYLKRIEDGEL